MKIGFIGTGNMGGALAKAVFNTLEEGEILLSNRTEAKAHALKEALGTKEGVAVTVTDNETVAREADYVFLGVKPQMMADTLSGLVDVFATRKSVYTLVTMAAGLTIEKINAMAGGSANVIRIMPNTPCSIGKGVILLSAGEGIMPGVTEYLKNLLSGAGVIAELPEKLIDAGSAVSGCGPAYMYMAIEALSDAGVKCGLPRATATLLAAKTMEGSAALQLETGKHPGVLKDEVCSPGGSTIAGVDMLEAGAFRGTIMDAVSAAYERTKELGK